MNLKKLPIDVSSFEVMIKDNYLYIDKTQHIYNIFIAGNRYHFLSRPRRFGKSLLVSTLKELFSGNKELFKDLWIYSSDWDWQKYPTIALDFSKIAHLTACELRANLNDALIKISKVRFPNFEIKQSFTKYLLVALYKYNLVKINNKIFDLKNAIEQNNLINFFEGI